MQPFKLIQISNHSPRRRGTFECYTRALAEAVRSAGGTCHLVYFAEPEPWFREWMAEAGAVTHPLPFSLTEPEKPWQIAIALRRLVPARARTLVHVQFPILNGICPALRAMGYRKIILSDQLSGVCRDLPPGLRRLKNLANRLQVSGASAITALSSHIMERQIAAGIPAERTRVLHIGCELREYAVPSPELRARLRIEHGFGAGDVVVCFAGRLMPEKGVDVLLKAISTVQSSVPGIRLLIVGHGVEEKLLRIQAQELELADLVRFVGHVPSVVPYLQLSDIFVCPSRWEEGFGYVNIEAMAVGLPVIASRAGGITDVVKDGRTGFLVRPGDHLALARSLELLASDSDLRVRMGEEGNVRAREEFSLQSTLTRTMQIYSEVVVA